ncbi:hypothetical protein GIB67_039045 [Kingdonia uniflora]|uniref:RING-type E3 ubiquitin transferase n=1 Tax=Kingdonia uniflora TaxID=39325 RepID=A0A7J7LL29_9MAGN|nr:hypothetical protein GIB67_039045 [Kingdonia uniflora]
MGNRRSKWRFSLHRSSPTTPKTQNPQSPPEEFVCPISGSLMGDPVIVASGQTFERSCIQACKNLGFTPTLPNGSKPDLASSLMIPNIAIKATIQNWCDSHSVEWPKSIEGGEAEKLVRGLMGSDDEEEKGLGLGLGLGLGFEVSEKELLESVKNTPPGKFVHAATELNRRTTSHFYSSSSEESVVSTIPDTPLPLATRPCCYSSSSSSSLSSEIETLLLNPNLLSEEEEEMIVKLKSSQVFEQEEGVISLRKITKSKEELRVSICTPRLLSAVRSLLISRYLTVQVNAVAAVVNLSLEKSNKVKIVRLGIVPVLIDLLKGGFPESQEHAAGALFSLALDDENKTAIGVLGALPPLLHMLRSESKGARNDSALALYHLSLDSSNRTKLLKLGSIPTLLTLAKTGDLASRALLILCNLAACSEGRAAMLDSNAVECFVGMLREIELGSDANAMRENCISALYALSQGSLRFKGLAKDAGAVEVLRKVMERLSNRARDKTMKMLEMMRSPTEREGHQQEWENIVGSILGSGVMNWNHNKGDGGANSSGF